MSEIFIQRLSDLFPPMRSKNDFSAPSTSLFCSLIHGVILFWNIFPTVRDFMSFCRNVLAFKTYSSTVAATQLDATFACTDRSNPATHDVGCSLCQNVPNSSTGCSVTMGVPTISASNDERIVTSDPPPSRVPGSSTTLTADNNDK